MRWRSVGLRFTLETSTKSTLLLIFFASIGLTADLSLLRRGGPRLVRFLLAPFPFLVVQNALGSSQGTTASIRASQIWSCFQRRLKRSRT